MFCVEQRLDMVVRPGLLKSFLNGKSTNFQLVLFFSHSVSCR